MDPGPLVEGRIDDGRYLLERLAAAGFDVSAAAWVKTADDEKWGLYVVSKRVDELGFSPAYGAAAAVLGRGPDAEAPTSYVKLVSPESPLGRHLVETQRRFGDGGRGWVQLTRLGDVAALEAYLYPPIATDGLVQQPLAPKEVAQKVVELMGRTGHVRPSRVTLRDGKTFLGVPFGLELSGGHMQVKFAVDGPEPPLAYSVEAIRTIE